MAPGISHNMGSAILLCAKGAAHPKPGASPQDFESQRTIPSAESAIHSPDWFVHDRGVAQSLSKILLHVVFSTKNREPWLQEDVRRRIHAYMATVCRDLGAEVSDVHGVSDHVHIITTLPRTISQAELLQKIKTTSSKWIKTLDAEYRGFSWQRGYAAVSVSPSQLDVVLQYVRNQEEHHRSRSFQEEYRELLRKHGIEFDEQFVWD